MIAEQIGGAVLVAAILADVFLTVLYARMGSGLLSPLIARIVWGCFAVVGRRVGRARAKLLSFCGPIILVCLVLFWMLGLSVGNALLFQPMLGASLQASSGKTPTDFITALYAGGSSVSLVAASDFVPRRSTVRLLYLLNSIIGLSVASLTLTYLMQIYSQLQHRNAFALKVYLATRQTGDAAELLAGLGPRGAWSNGASFWWEIAAEMATTKEAHHFYPVMFYMRFPEPFYSISFITLVLLDSVTLMRSVVGHEYADITELRALDQLWDGCLLLLTSLESTFLEEGPPEREEPRPEEVARWMDRFGRASERLAAAGISTNTEKEALEKYVSLRAEWNSYIQRLAPKMLYSMRDIDTGVRQ